MIIRILIFLLISLNAYSQIDTIQKSKIEEVGVARAVYPLHPYCVDNSTQYSEWSSCNVEYIKSFIEANLRWPSSSPCFEGTVVFQLVINEEGITEEINLIRGLNKYADAESKRVAIMLVKDAGLWHIEYEKYPPNKYYLNIPFEFKLE